MNPDQKPMIVGPGGPLESDQTNAEITMQGLTAECLRDIARNESAERLWRKAAIKFLINRNHKYQHHVDFRELAEEIRTEQEAETEVQAVVESALEAPISSLSELEE